MTLKDETFYWPIQRWRLHPPHFGYGQCAHCQWPWWARKPHSVYHEVSSGLFVLCERCWPRVSVDLRVAYAAQWCLQHRINHEEWLRIKAAHEEAV